MQTKSYYKYTLNLFNRFYISFAIENIFDIYNIASMENISREFYEMFKKIRIGLTSDDIKKINNNTKDLINLSNSMQEWAILTNKLINEYKNRMVEIQDESKFSDTNTNLDKNSNFRFVSLNHNKKLSWVEINDIENEKEMQSTQIDNMIERITTSSEKIKELEVVNNVDIGSIKVPIIKNLDELPPAINWYVGDKINKAGLYISLMPNYAIEIPFPDTIDGTKNSNRTNSIKCKYGSLSNCKAIRENLANKYRSEIRKCNFAHIGDHYIKIGTFSRCPGAPSFGNYDDFKEDMEKINMSDVEMLLMYATSDLLLANIWVQNNNTNNKNNMNDETIVFNNLDICK